MISTGLVSEHRKASGDHQHDHNQAPVLLFQLEEDGPHEDEDDTGALGDGVEGHIYVLKAPLRESNVQTGNNSHHTNSTYHQVPPKRDPLEACVQSVSSSAASSKAELHDEVGEDDGERELELFHQP